MNIWDLPVPFPGLHRRRRRALLLELLPGLAADLILIQEAFIPRFKARLAESLDRYHADAYLGSSRRIGPFRMDTSGGLLTFSRWPIARSCFLAFATVPRSRIDERIGGKGCLWTEIETPVGGLLVGNTHLYAGIGVFNARARAAQAGDLLAQFGSLPPLPTVIAGDFNMAAEHEQPGYRATGFEMLRAAGFSEIAGGSSTELVTMAPSMNRYARLPPFHSLDRRLTQVFFRGGLQPGPEPATVCLDDPPVSNHFGLMATLELDHQG